MIRGLPEPTELTLPYWEAARAGSLHLQRCESCRRFVHFPEVSCPFCGGVDLAWTAAPYRGTVHTFSVIHRTFAPGFADLVPYVIAWVELDGHPEARLFGNVSGCAPDQVSIGMAVDVIFEDLKEFGPIPNFRVSNY